MRSGAQFFLAVALLAGGRASEAHKLSDSYLTLAVPAADSVLSGRWDIALRDLNHAIGIDSNADGLITWGELKAGRPAIVSYAFAHLRLEALSRGARADCALRAAALLFDEHADGGYAVLPLSVACPFRPATLIVHYSLLFEIDPNHRGLMNVLTPTTSQALVLAPTRSTAAVDLGSPSRTRQLLGFVTEGIWHILKGFDHILFLITLLLPAVVIYTRGHWEPRATLRDALVDVLKVVTAFTVAHSITLSLAVNGLVSLPSRLVESGIALTVLLGALNNLVPVVSERRWAVAFAFGLIHGLGFASVLADLGLAGWNLVRALVGFNIGVEAGQLVIVVMLVPLAFGLRRTRFYRRVFMPEGAIVISCVAIYWLTTRLFGISLQ